MADLTVWRCPAHGIVELPTKDHAGVECCPHFIGMDETCLLPCEGPMKVRVLEPALSPEETTR